MLEAGLDVAHRLRHGVRSARDRGVRGQRGRLPAEAGRAGAAGDWRSSASRKRLATGPTTGRRQERTELEPLVQLLADRQSRREQLAIKVGERFLLVQADEIIHASLEDEASGSSRTACPERPTTGRSTTAGAARPGRLLARAPVASGEHQQDQGDRALVQSELHPEDEGRESDGDPGQPIADAAAAGVSEAVSDSYDHDPYTRLPEPQRFERRRRSRRRSVGGAGCRPTR